MVAITNPSRLIIIYRPFSTDPRKREFQDIRFAIQKGYYRKGIMTYSEYESELDRLAERFPEYARRIR